MSTTEVHADLEREARWASRALSLRNTRDANAICTALIETLDQLRQQEVPHRAEHPAAQLLIGGLAELAGLQFHWPAGAELQCRSAMARYRAASTCIELTTTATTTSST